MFRNTAIEMSLPDMPGNPLVINNLKMNGEDYN